MMLLNDFQQQERSGRAGIQNTTTDCSLFIDLPSMTAVMTVTFYLRRAGERSWKEKTIEK